VAGTEGDSVTRKTRRKPLESLKTDSGMAAEGPLAPERERQSSRSAEWASAAATVGGLAVTVGTKWRRSPLKTLDLRLEMSPTRREADTTALQAACAFRLR
jgi:hypothetical protein